MLDRPAPAYEFTQDWFSPHIRVWDDVIAAVNPSKILEIGSYEGKATTYLLDKCSFGHDLYYVALDTWEGGHNDLSVEMMKGVEERFDRNVKIACERALSKINFAKFKMTSTEGLVKLLGKGLKFDFIYVDGAHTAPIVLSDAVMSYHLLKKGGVMCFDDYLWGQGGLGLGGRHLADRPKPAIDAFINIFSEQVAVVCAGSNVQMMVQKVVE